MATSTDSPQILQRSCSGRFSARWTLRKSEVSVHVVSYTFMYKPGWNPNSQHAGTWVTASWPPYLLYYHQAVFFCHVCLIAHIFKMLLLDFFFFTFLKLHNLKLCKLGCVCTVLVNGEYLTNFGILNPMLVRVDWSTGAKGLMKDKSDCGAGIA